MPDIWSQTIEFPFLCVPGQQDRFEKPIPQIGPTEHQTFSCDHTVNRALDSVERKAQTHYEQLSCGVEAAIS